MIQKVSDRIKLVSLLVLVESLTISIDQHKEHLLGEEMCKNN